MANLGFPTFFLEKRTTKTLQGWGGMANLGFPTGMGWYG